MGVGFGLSMILSKHRSSKNGACQGGGVGFGISGRGGPTARDVMVGVFISLLSNAVALVGEEDEDVLGHLTRIVNLKGNSAWARKISISSGHDRLNHELRHPSGPRGICTPVDPRRPTTRVGNKKGGYTVIPMLNTNDT